MTIVLADPDFILYRGEALAVLRTLADESVDCVVTSPPYWNLRDYAIDGQLGLEATPEAYVASMVAVFAEIRRALTKTGTCWLNLGDSYAGSGAGSSQNLDTLSARYRGGGTKHSDASIPRPATPRGALKTKDLVGIPWRVAFALQADGWYLRSDVIWAKANPMPESIADRPSKSHEYVFLLTKSARYYFDQEAAREPYTPDGRRATHIVGRSGSIQHRDGERWPNSGRNLRSVWTIATQAYAEAHFATFPEELPRRCIVAGCPEWVCTTCGKPRERIIETTYEPHGASAKSGGDFAGERTGGDLAHGSLRPQEMKHGRATRIDSTLGWSDCGHASYRAGIVLDPFMGSGTTAKVARDNARHALGIELNPDYCDLIARRNQQLSLFTYEKGSS